MEEQNNSTIFRKKSLDSISSPEQLTDYLKVTNPGIWLLLAAIVLILAGLFFWSTMGSLETTVSATAVVEDGTAAITMNEQSVDELASGMIVRFGKNEYIISSVETDYIGRVTAFAPVRLADGMYDVKVVTESIAPIRFLLS